MLLVCGMVVVFVVLASCFSAVGCVCGFAVHAACNSAPAACYPAPAASYPAPSASYPAPAASYPAPAACCPPPAACFPAGFGLHQVNPSPAHLVLLCKTCHLSMSCVIKATLILGHSRGIIYHHSPTMIFC